MTCWMMTCIHSGEEIASILYSKLKEWSIVPKMLDLTLDYASNNSTLIHHMLELAAGDNLLHAGEYLHNRWIF